MTYLELLKSIEFWAGFNPNDVIEDAKLKETFTARLNRRLDRYFGIMGSGSRLAQIDDTNYSNQPFSFFDIVEGQNDYQFLSDEDGNTISDITSVMIAVGSSFRVIDKASLSDKDAELIMSPNDRPGVPNKYLERNNTIFLDPVPNYSKTNGGKLFYKRVPSYFQTTDTTKQPGIPSHLHEILAIGASYDWLLVNKPNASMEITRVELELDKMEKDFRVYVELRNPQSRNINIKRENSR